MIVTFFYYFGTVIKRGQLEAVFKIVEISYLFLFINIMLGVMGVGYGMYGIDEGVVGTRGLIFAGNELGVAVLVSGSVLMMRSLVKMSYFKYLFFGLSSIAMSVAMTTKVSMIGVMLVFLIFPVFALIDTYKNFRNSKKALYFSLLTTALSPFIFLIGGFYAIYESGLINRLLFFYEKLDLLSFILSGRDVWVVEAINYFFRSDLTQILFGSGFLWLDQISDSKLTENDFVDFLLTYGLIGSMAISFFIVRVWQSAIKNNSSGDFFKYSLFLLFLMIGISLTAGHVFNSGTAGFLISIVVKNDDQKFEE
jgi:hypothetical protein